MKSVGARTPRKVAPAKSGLPPRDNFRLFIGPRLSLNQFDHPTKWRRLALLVGAGGIEAEWEGKSIGKLDPGRLGPIFSLAGVDAKVPGFDAAAVWQPRGGIGLFVNRALAEFRNIVVTPLPNPEPP